MFDLFFFSYLLGDRQHYIRLRQPGNVLSAACWWQPELVCHWPTRRDTLRAIWQNEPEMLTWQFILKVSHSYLHYYAYGRELSRPKCLFFDFQVKRTFTKTPQITWRPRFRVHEHLKSCRRIDLSRSEEEMKAFLDLTIQLRFFLRFHSNIPSMTVLMNVNVSMCDSLIHFQFC